MAERATVTEITVTVRYFAAARATAGAAEESLTVSVVPTVAAVRETGDGHGSGVATVGTVLDAAIGRHGAALATVLRRCSFLLDEVAVHGTDTQVRAGQTLDVLPPFAGG